jgi:hypothetical protein
VRAGAGSSTETYAATVARARALGLALAELPAHGDVDTPKDLEHLRATIAALGGEDEAAARFLRHTRAALLDLARLAP